MPYVSYAERMLYTSLLKYLKKEDIKSQVKIGDHFVDFLIFNQLIIEVDGPYHEKRKGRDEKIDKMLSEKGYIVKRVSAKRIHKNLEGVTKEIISLIFPDKVSS